MARVYERWGSCVFPRELEDIGLENTPQYDPYEDETQNKQSFPHLAKELEPMSEVEDHYIGAEILLPRGNHMARGHVVARSRDANGNVMGRYHTNSILDSRMYQVEFTWGKVTELIANVIAESVYAQCNLDGNEYLLLYMLVDYRKNNKAISLSDQQITVQGRSINCKTTASWQIYYQWKDGSTSWEKLSELKESHLVQTAEFTVAQGIDHEPASNWWVKHVLKKEIELLPASGSGKPDI